MKIRNHLEIYEWGLCAWNEKGERFEQQRVVWTKSESSRKPPPVPEAPKTEPKGDSDSANLKIPASTTGDRRKKLEERMCLRLSRFRSFDPERLEHVAARRERRRAEAEERIRASGQGARDLSGNGEHLPSVLEREVGRDQRAASLTRLDDDGGGAETGDDPIACREPPRRGLNAGFVLGDDQCTLRDLPRE